MCRVVILVYIPLDFPLANIDQETLDKVSEEIKEEDIYPLSPLQSGLLFYMLCLM